MKKSIAVFILLSLTLLAIFFTSGCVGTRIKYLPPEEFVAQSKRIGTSIKWTTNIGVSETRAYLEHHELGVSSNSRTTVYWTELEALPYNFRNKLKEGAPPCPPLQEERKEKRSKFTLLRDIPGT